MITRILLDMDEVLVDFVAGVCKLFKITKEDLYAHWRLGEWDIVPPLSKCLGRNFNQDDLWNSLQDSSSFWISLSKLPWCKALYEECLKITDNVHIVSSPFWCPTSYLGKIIWLKELFGREFNKFDITSYRELFAKPGVVLIDDSPGNLAKFRGHGGDTILFPRHQNELYKYRDDPLFYVSKQLQRLQNKG